MQMHNGGKASSPTHRVMHRTSVQINVDSVRTNSVASPILNFH